MRESPNAGTVLGKPKSSVEAQHFQKCMGSNFFYVFELSPVLNFPLQFQRDMGFRPLPILRFHLNFANIEANAKENKKWIVSFAL